ncbi:MAG: glycosyltransferase [Peptostreptococcaceae bacterium]|nr:glycosyltransferase [Peptostreptococcaceae bacterium]
MRYFNGNYKDSLSTKFSSQISAASNLELDVWYIACKEDGIYLCHKDNQQRISPIKFRETKSIFYTVRYYTALYQSIISIVSQNNRFDYVYIRNMFVTPSYIKALKQIQRKGSKCIVEIPTYPAMSEYSSEKNILRRITLFIQNKFEILSCKHVDLFALIGEPATQYHGRPAVNIGNGIHICDIPLRKQEVLKDEIHILALASMSRWQGFDRIIEGMYEYRQKGGNKQIKFHLVGPDGDGSIKEWRALSNQYGLQDSVLFEGPIYGDDLTLFINKCDIGVASLGLYRKGFNNTSVLKIREYMVRGIPFIYAGNDFALNENNNFHIKVPNDDSTIDIQRIVEFALMIRKNTQVSIQMRKYAKENMTWEKQFVKIFNEFIK